jgi:Vault protein inter-alpha-trypsin domain
MSDKTSRYTAACFLLLLLKAPSIAIAETFARLESYAVNMTIVNRFARTRILVTAVNEGECATLLGLNLQLPVNARVKSLTMDLSDDCTRNGVIKTEAEAQAEFDAKVQQGKPGALLEAYDLASYGVQISIPALGATRVELELEELLQRKRGKIHVSIPIFPEMKVEELVMDVSIQEQGTIQPFHMHNIDETKMSSFLTLSVPTDNETEVALTAHLEVFSVPQDGRISEDVVLPRILRGSYNVGALPEEGLMIPDSAGKCFAYLFDPSLLAVGGAMPRNIVFAIDVSRSTGCRYCHPEQAQ